MQRVTLRVMASHGVVSTGVPTPESFGFDNPETTPLSIPTNPATPPAALWGRKSRDPLIGINVFADKPEICAPNSGAYSWSLKLAVAQIT